MIVTLSTLLRGSNREKLRWIFSRLYDFNGNGFITKRELFDIVSAVHDLVGVSKQVRLTTPGLFLAVSTIGNPPSIT